MPQPASQSQSQPASQAPVVVEPQCCHCGSPCELGLEDLQGRSQCQPCEEDLFDDWFDRGF